MSAVMSLPANCFHCGQSLPKGAGWQVSIDGHVRPMCCPGCRSVAQAIVNAGLGEYYRTRSAYSETASSDGLIPAELLLYDREENEVRKDDNHSSEEMVFSIEGIRCAACVWLIERRLARLPGMQNAIMNVATEKLHVQRNTVRCKTSDILRALHDIGYRAYPYDAARHEAHLQRVGKTLFRQLFIAGLCMMQVMMYAVPVYLGADVEADMALLMRWASLLLTLPAVCYSAQPFFKGAWNDLRRCRAGMDVPVALGIAAAFAGSVAAMWQDSGEVYFDSVTMFIFLLLCSRYFELLARRRAAASLEKLQHALPAAVARLPSYPSGYKTETVSPAQLRVDDVILVRPGEAVAADGILLAGETDIDLSLLTGESVPQHRKAGDAMPGGAVNVEQGVLVRVTKAAHESTLSTLVKLIERAGGGKPQLALWADRVAAWFVTVLLLFAGAIFVFWHGADSTRAWPIAIAVLVVSCPCALSLATPTALAAATDSLVRRGVLIVQAHVLETLHRATHVIFDKTGTLTMGKPVLQHVMVFRDEPDTACLQLAAALEAASAHPLAQAIVAAAQERGLPLLEAQDIVHAAGRGVEGMIDGRRCRLGNFKFVEKLAGKEFAVLPAGDTPAIYLGSSGKWLACFHLADTMRADAHEVVKYFSNRGKTVILLSGDRQVVAHRVATDLGISSAHGEQLPEQKLTFVQALQKSGAVVAMVGDGINDAAVLRAADVSFAMGSGAALAQTHADAVLLSGRLASLVETARVASRTMAIVKQNLAWATLYNLIAIPAAALGLLNPWMAAVGMSLSSALVVANALRLLHLPAAASKPMLAQEAVLQGV